MSKNSAEEDILKELDNYIPENDSRKWARLASTINYRRLVLSLLKEILIELRKLNQKE
ncbi:MAG: hypothetical protein ABSA92_10970 [Candidatus Bathyarchaeia archaeon]